MLTDTDLIIVIYLALSPILMYLLSRVIRSYFGVVVIDLIFLVSSIVFIMSINDSGNYGIGNAIFSALTVSFFIINLLVGISEIKKQRELISVVENNSKKMFSSFSFAMKAGAFFSIIHLIISFSPLIYYFTEINSGLIVLGLYFSPIFNFLTVLITFVFFSVVGDVYHHHVIRRI